MKKVLGILCIVMSVAGISAYVQTSSPDNIAVTVFLLLFALILLWPKKKTAALNKERKNQKVANEEKKMKCPKCNTENTGRICTNCGAEIPVENTTINHAWYLQTWFICLLLAFWFFLIPLVIGIVLLIMQIVNNNKLDKKYGKIDDLNKRILNLDNIHSQTERNYTNEYFVKKGELDALKSEISELESTTILSHYNFSDYDSLSSEECKNKLALLKNDEQQLIKSEKCLNVASLQRGKKEIGSNIKQIIRCFNSECDNVLLNLSVKNIDASRSKIMKSFESLNKIFVIDGIQLSKSWLEYKLEELNLVYTYELKREQEHEQQKAIKAQMLEEEKVRREIEAEKAKIQKDMAQVSGEIKKLMSYMQKTNNDIEKQLYIDKIKELENKIKELEDNQKNVLEREANARAGFVYVISNIGSFGEDIYKIGMTRRLEPMDRVKELGSASVPFDFDVHAMIFSNDAPDLENLLHKHFEKYSVNRVNLRKEFFHVSLGDIENLVKEKYSSIAEFTHIPSASDYRRTLTIIENESLDGIDTIPNTREIMSASQSKDINE